MKVLITGFGPFDRFSSNPASSLQEFIAKEKEEMTEQEKGQQLEECMRMADFRVTNEGSLEDFYKKLEKFL